MLDLVMATDINEIEPLVATLVDRCRALGVSGQVLSLNIPVALTEALANAVLRGNAADPAQPVYVRMSVSADELVFDVIDQGSGFDMAQSVREPAVPENVEREDGRGLFLMRELMDDVQQFRDERGNVVRLILRRQLAADAPAAVVETVPEAPVRNLELEIENAARELAERYEEINLLYSISEILGRTVSLDEAATTILEEVSETVGARRAAIWVRERSDDVLTPIAALGIEAAHMPPIDVNDVESIPARVFRTRHPVVVDPADTEVTDAFREGALLAVPITLVTQRGKTELLGAMVLTDRKPRQAFSAGDVKLMVAIATQIGSAIQNARLVRASLEQQRLLSELQLAYDLQMKLLPRTDVVAPQAQVAARVIPAESVGGDFYHLSKLTPSATGVMIGDVSSHGYRAALIMALAMSAASIHAQSTLNPGVMLHALWQSLRDELSSTEMFISAFYGVVDTSAGTLQYANAGHPYAFICRANGELERLGAENVPLGLGEDTPVMRVQPWNAGRDLLVLFTDGVSDATNAAGARLGEDQVLRVIREHRTAEPEVLVEHVLAMVRAHVGETPLQDDVTILVLRS